MQTIKIYYITAKRKQLAFSPIALLLFIFYFQLFTFNANAQAPERFPYQAVIRNNAGDVLKDRPVNIRVHLLQDTTLEMVYGETHSVKTNEFGLVGLEIGNGDSLHGNFSSINWKSGNVYIEIALKEDENDYTVMGTTQLLSVPYAYYAKTAVNVNDDDTCIYNELQSLKLEDTTLLLTKTRDSINLARFRDGVNDADSILGNEWIDSVTIEGNNLLVHEGEQTILLNIQNIQNDADSVIGNELIDSVKFRNDTLIISEGNGTHITKVCLGVLNQKNMSVDDDDADPLNEIQYFKRDDNLLYLTDINNNPTEDTVSLDIYDKDEQNLTVEKNNKDTVLISIERGDTVSFSITDNDHCDTNEIQNLLEVLLRGNNADEHNITGIPSPVDDGDAANYRYVDSLLGELTDIFTWANIYDFLNDTSIDEIIYFNSVGLLKDNRDNQVYRIQKIEGTWWMLDDLDYEGANGLGYYYEDTSDPTNRHYGKYYTRDELEDNDVCPDGWDIPQKNHFDQLHQNYDGEELLVEDWSGLDLVIAGYYVYPVSDWFDNYVYYWTKDGSDYVYYNLDLDDYSYEFGTTGSSVGRLRVRCVK